jgi:hypothetical protein
MLAMHYAIPLKGADQLAAVRARAAERGPWFDGMAGLRAKLFLLDPIDPCYATFYLWCEANAALSFLEGPFFKALAETFGRPEVKLLLTTATDLPFAMGEALRLRSIPSDNALSLVRALDPRTGEVLGLAPASAPGRQFDVMYRAVGTLPRARSLR